MYCTIQTISGNPQKKVVASFVRRTFVFVIIVSNSDVSESDVAISRMNESRDHSRQFSKKSRPWTPLFAHTLPLVFFFDPPNLSSRASRLPTFLVHYITNNDQLQQKDSSVFALCRPLVLSRVEFHFLVAPLDISPVIIASTHDSPSSIRQGK